MEAYYPHGTQRMVDPLINIIGHSSHLQAIRNAFKLLFKLFKKEWNESRLRIIFKIDELRWISSTPLGVELPLCEAIMSFLCRFKDSWKEVILAIEIFQAFDLRGS